MSASVESNLARLFVDLHPPVARIALHHAPLNVIDIPMMEELALTLTEIELHANVSTLVLSGEGKAFSVG